MGIIVDGLSYAYGCKQVLDTIHFTVKEGETVGIVGISGGGKSTLLKLIGGLYEVQSGNIAIGSARTSLERRKRVAMVMQNAMLLPASIRDNITCGHEMDEAMLRYVCDAAQLGEWVTTLPDGLDTFVGERGNRVSGGQAQRIAIARAIAKNASVVLLDEPTSALDGDTGVALMNALMSLTKGKTVLHVSHHVEMLANCDRILQLKGGRLYAW